MKKTKLLIPVLSIAGLAAAVAPIATMTSCGGKGESKKDDWEKSSFEELKSAMGLLYKDFNKEDNFNSFARSDLVVKYNGQETTDYIISDSASYDDDTAEFLDKVTEVEILNTQEGNNVKMPVFYPQTDFQKYKDMGLTLTVTKKDDNYKVYVPYPYPLLPGAILEATFIINKKGYVTNYVQKLSQGSMVYYHHKIDIEYKVDLHPVSDYTFMSDKDNQYIPLQLMMKNNTEYKLNVKNSKAALSKFQINYFVPNQQISLNLNLQDGVTITANGEEVTTSWKTDHLEFDEEIPAGTDIIITINKTDIPNNFYYFEATFDPI